MKKKIEINTGKNIYADLKKNTYAVWTILIISIVCIVSAFVFAQMVYKDSVNKIYTINDAGNLIPLSLVSDQEDKVKVIKANSEYFIKNLYDLDQYSIKEKKEKVLWLIGEQPTKIVKDKDSKGYYNDFMTINGLVQKVEIIPNSWEISNIDTHPNSSFSIIIRRINGLNESYYKADINLTMTKVNINYPFNPFGYLITNYAERLQKMEKPTVQEEQKKDSLIMEYQNPTIP